MRLVRMAMCAAIAMSAFGAEEAQQIDPFGPFSWRTGLFDVIQAARLVDPGAQLVWRDDSKPGIEPLPISGISSITDLRDVLHDLLGKEYPTLFEELLNKRRGGARTYSIPGGAEQTYLMHTSMELTITDSIHIADVPFSLVAKLSLAPGFALVSPDSVVTDSSGRLAFPLVLTEVSMSSWSPLLDERQPQINKLLWDKYGHLESNPESNARISDDHARFGGRLLDARGNILTVKSNRGGGMFLKYSSYGVIEEMADAYRAFLVKEEAKAHAGAEDLSSEL